MMSSVAYILQYLPRRFNEELFPEHGGCKHRGRRIKCIIIADDMALLAEDERMLKNMLMDLNERCEDYGMKINISKTKAMVIGRNNSGLDGRCLSVCWNPDCRCRRILPKSRRLPFSGFLPLDVSSPAVGDIFRSGRCRCARCRGSQRTVGQRSQKLSFNMNQGLLIALGNFLKKTPDQDNL